MTEIFELTPEIRGEWMVLCHAAVPNEILYRSRDPEAARRVFDGMEAVWERGRLHAALGLSEADPRRRPIVETELIPHGTYLRLNGHEIFYSSCPQDAAFAQRAFRRAATIAAGY